ncbi:MAG: elongation factor G [Planctomycetes bacterium]|nr:elongation factor G [Planctomycetota bacterium]MCB9910628.1 elongation factor G [Planctomycetota bacterium]HPF13489.1 elongation factor G [Planctomycetota bacterium]
MRELASLHNIAFVGHPGSGKTTLVDALAFEIGASARKGSVADGTSICDTEPEEQEKKHTLQNAFVSGNWGDKAWTFIDTPGYPEFQAQVQAACYAADLVVGVVHAASGVTFNLRAKMAAAKAMGRGRAIVITHLDADNVDFDKLIDELRSKLGNECVPALIPNGSGAGFTEVHRTVNHPENAWCSRLEDRVMDACEDEALLARYLETQELSPEELDTHMPNAIARGSLVPVLVCNPETGVAVPKTLEFFQRFAPSPRTVPTLDAQGLVVEPVREGEASGTVFSVISDPHLGRVCLARIHRGTLKAHDTVTNGQHKPEKMGGLFRLVGKNREPLEDAGPGEIIAFAKVEHLGPWQNFATSEAAIVQVPVPEVPQPMVAMAVTPMSRNDEQKIGESLNKLAVEDPSLRIEHTTDTHELVLHGMSDLHLQVMLMRLQRRFQVACETHLPKIAYRQSITQPSEGHCRHKKQSGGRGQFGECFLRLRPGASGSGIVFVDNVVGGAIPRNLIPAVEKGVREQAAHGVLTKGEVVDVEVEVYDGKFHAVDSDEASFKHAGALAFRDGVLAAKPVLLEPMMELEIHVPTEMAGIVFSDLTSHRRGHVLDQTTEESGHSTLIRAEAPLATMQTYFRDLKSQTAGEGSYNLRFARYAPMPAAEQKKVLAEHPELAAH